MAMSPRVRWHADLPDEELRRIYRQSDLLVLPLCDCTANNALQEGLACGLPVIVTDVGGVRDYANEQFADFVRPGDAAGFIERLKDCIAHKDKLVARGASARTFVEQQLSWKKVAARYAAMLRSLP
jgi:glycosyltransferase involved in cell wall biosynthesis